MAHQNNNDDDCWDDLFGHDEDDYPTNDPNHELTTTIQTGVLFLTQQFLKLDPQISLSQRRVVLVSLPTTNGEDGNTDDATDEERFVWSDQLAQRGIQCVTPGELSDAAVVMGKATTTTATTHLQDLQLARRNVVAGGILLLVSNSSQDVTAHIHALDGCVWNTTDPQTLQSFDLGHRTTVMAILKHPCPINERSCVWKNHSPQKDAQERALLQEATVTRSAHELVHGLPLTTHKQHEASAKLTAHGYCVVRHLLHSDMTTQCEKWGLAVKDDLQQANEILQARDGIDLRHPLSSTMEPQNYRELSMREDLRMDIREGPNIQLLHQEEADHYESWGILIDNTNGGTGSSCNTPVISTSKGSLDSCLRFHADVLEIVRLTMNPKDADLFKGNLGRFNFDGSGPDGSYQPLRIGPMGGILSLPGSADQALHADTPHLFEHLDCLPAHYINVFTQGADVGVAVDSDGNATGSSDVGGTAFVHGSHRLSFTAAIANDPDESESGLLSASGRSIMFCHLVRPSLQLGDVVLFDCRILHFGLANHSETVERPMLYVNMTHAFFHDPKNWDERRSIFD